MQKWLPTIVMFGMTFWAASARADTVFGTPFVDGGQLITVTFDGANFVADSGDLTPMVLHPGGPTQVVSADFTLNASFVGGVFQSGTFSLTKDDASVLFSGSLSGMTFNSGNQLFEFTGAGVVGLLAPNDVNEVPPDPFGTSGFSLSQGAELKIGAAVVPLPTSALGGAVLLTALGCLRLRRGLPSA